MSGDHHTSCLFLVKSNWILPSSHTFSLLCLENSKLIQRQEERQKRMWACMWILSLMLDRVTQPNGNQWKCFPFNNSPWESDSIFLLFCDASSTAAQYTCNVQHVLFHYEKNGSQDTRWKLPAYSQSHAIPWSLTQLQVFTMQKAE